MSTGLPQDKASFSDKIAMEEFSQSRTKTKKATLIFGVIVVLAIWIGFFALASAGEIAMTTALLQAAVVTGIILLFTVFKGFKSRKEVTWTGEIVDKKIEQRRERENYGDKTRFEMKTHYFIFIKEDGTQQIKRWEVISREHYNYYAVGDRVKHHHGFTYYEKNDKTNDDTIICIACGRLTGIEQSNCRFCKLPLLN